MKIFTILLLTMLSGCVCSQIKQFDIKERRSYSVQFNKCRCHQYDLNAGKRVSEAVDHPAAYCDDVIGFKYDDWVTEITPKLEYNYELYCEYCTK